MNSALFSRSALAPTGLAIAIAAAAACGKAPAAAPAPVAPVVAPAPAVVPVQWSTSATAYRGQLGQTITVLCPPNGSPSSVWGSDLYSDDSSICTAALHSGRVTLAQGGTVQITIAAGALAYVPTTRNGVTTSPWGQWTGSFTIVGGAAPGLATTPVGGAPAGPADWSTDGQSVAPGATSAVITCPPNGTPDSVWGTDVYSGDSSACTAAVHAGLITFVAGGPVRVSGLPGAPAYAGTTRNGVTTSSWPAYSASFRVEAAR